MDSFHNELTDDLMDIIVNVKTREDCYALFEDLCTINEILDMSKRLRAVKLLAEGLSYKEIGSAINISTATLSRVSHALKYGAGGYEKIIKEINKKNKP